MAVVQCPKCGARVPPTPSGKCPNCNQPMVKPNQAPPPCSEADGLADAVDPGLVGINGWLILPAIGLVLGLVLTPVGLVAVILATVPETPEFAAWLAANVYIGLGIYVYLWVAAIRFFNKEPTAPGTLIRLLLAQVVASLVVCLLALVLLGTGAALAQVSNPISAVVAAAIWIPYFLVSKRVKATFRPARLRRGRQGDPQKMNEHLKTIGFVAVALAVVAVVVWSTRPRLPQRTEEGQLPKMLFAEFDDPLAAASLEIVKFDEETATLRPFKVARVDEEWSIPSHSNYPADAENQLAQVAASFIGLKPLDVASETPGDHDLFGVVDPDPDTLEVGDTGVGTRVEIRDKNDDPLLELIVGKEVPDRDELRYVRMPGKDPVYTVKLDTNKLSTRFEDWIEDDLLKLNTWDVKQVQINDYSVDILQGLLDPRSRMTLEYDDAKSEWKLAEDQAFDRQEEKWVAMEMAEDEELNTSTLNDMKFALDDLKIVDVRRKPEGLSANLKNTGPLQLDREALQSLQSRGFYINQNQLLSSEGEVNIVMKDGVQYVLRFGQIAAGTEQASQSEEEGEEDKESGGVNRYLFVMAEFNPNVIPKPELEPLPGEEKAKETSEGDKPEEEPSGGNGAAEETPPPAENAEPAPEPAQSTQAEADAPQAAAPEADASEEKPKESSESEEKPAGEEKEEKSEPIAPETKKDDQKSDTDAERQRIEKENQRKQDEYDKKISEAKKRVQELNDRFADWYYVISDEVYRKIHLGRDDVIQKKEKDEGEGADAEPDDAQPKEEGSGVSDFDELKQEGLKVSEE